MEHYLTFTVENFVMDRYFRQWVTGELPDTDTSWQEFQLRHLHKMDDIDLARRIVKALAMHHETLSDADLRAEIQRILADLPLSARVGPLYRLSWFRQPAVQIAASVMLLLAIGGYWYGQQRGSILPALSFFSNNQTGSQLVSVRNDGRKPTRVALNDGSTVTLEPNSELRYPTAFDGATREVFLTGEAFFDVAKNPEKPFLVQTAAFTTKVLGTQFRVNARETNPSETVSVLSGKVSVFAKTNALTDASLTDGIVLIPNQKAVFVKAQERLVKTLVDAPVLLTHATQINVATFDDAPAADVFERLEAAYGVRFIVDTDLLRGCTLKASFTTETLYQKVDLLCEAIGATYQIVDGQLVISTKGCQ